MACSLRWILIAFFIQAANSLHQNGLLTEDQYQMALCVKSIAVQNFPPGRMLISLPDTVSNPSTHKLSLEQRDNDNFAFADFVFKLMNEVMRWDLKSFIPSDAATNVQFDYILQYRDEIPQYHIVLAWSYDEEGDIIEIITNQIIAMILSFSTNQRGKFLLVMPGYTSVSVKDLLFEIFENLLNVVNVFDVTVIIPTQDESNNQSKGLTDSNYPTFDVYTWFPFQSPISSAESIALLNQWLGINEGEFIHNRDMYRNKIPRSFGGRKISVSPVVFEPLSWLMGNYTDEDGETNYNITGPEFDLLQIVCHELDLHISYEPVKPEVKLHQQVVETIIEMVSLPLDVAIGHLSFFVRTQCVLDYTVPILSLPERLFVPCPSPNSRLEKISEIFDVYSWSAMLVAFLLLTLTAFLSAKNRRNASRESSAYKSISSCLYNMWAVHLGVSVTDMPRTTILRTLFIMCVWYAYAMGNLFQIYFTSFLVDPGLEKAVTNTEEYVDAHLYLEIQNGYAWYFGGLIHDMPIKRFEKCYASKGCLKEMFTNKNYSTVTFEHWMEYYAKVNYPRRETKLCFLKDRQNIRPYTIFLRRGSPYLESFNRMVHRVLQSGIMAHFMKK
ncbi:hypothetical protein ANN_16824 [Periplaneta americana]|uniref:Uncharacterized protein n=1 Tax=Periplaneta americana TaxID=6978 RepID=A0ABQ8SR65_PERAM|nr:hypothetical protein ANN_16824 [Periplaneta americana]